MIVGTKSTDVFNKLHAAGLLQGDPNYVKRVVIDLEVGKAAYIYYQMFADNMDGDFGDVLVAGLTGEEKPAWPTRQTP